jgi:acyl-CoA synthetase (AMP-forming)/AMP-acid ligase II
MASVRSPCGGRTRCGRRPGGWRRLGDLGSIADGHLGLTDRKGAVIIRGGENIYPWRSSGSWRATRRLRRRPSRQCPDRRLGEVPLAVVVPADPALALKTL